MRWQELNEIEVGGELPGSYVDDINLNTPKIDDKQYKIVGRIDSYFVVSTTFKTPEGYSTFILFDHPSINSGKIDQYDLPMNNATKYRAFGYIYCKKVKKQWIVGNGCQVKGIYIKEKYRGEDLALKLYYWLLQNGYDYIMADTLQTRGGVAIWKKLLNSHKFAVFVHDRNRQITRKRKSGSDFNQVYKANHYFPVAMLPAKANQLIYS